MPPNKSNVKPEYKSKLKLELENYKMVLFKPLKLI